MDREQQHSEDNGNDSDKKAADEQPCKRSYLTQDIFF